jgi:deferrochelatase/peroxidase EfeB
MPPVRRRPGGGPAPRAAHPDGVAGRQRDHVVLAAFDVTGDLRGLLAEWAAAAAEERDWVVTLGAGASLFAADRFGLADVRPARLHPLPVFPGDDLDPARCDGDLLVMVAADLAETAAAAADGYAALAEGAAEPRWRQTGFLRPGRGTRRNLLGFKDGSMNPRRPWDLDRWVWVTSGERTWMVGGTYLVYRRIRLELPGWEALGVDEQERIVGRHKTSGAPLGHAREFDPRILEELPPDSHVVTAAARTNRGAAMLRRGYSYADAPGDAGLVFLAFQKDPRRQFAPVMARLAEQDALRAHVTPTGSAVFALPPVAGLTALAQLA